jgi:hypothetical protein
VCTRIDRDGDGGRSLTPTGVRFARAQKLKDAKAVLGVLPKIFVKLSGTDKATTGRIDVFSPVWGETLELPDGEGPFTFTFHMDNDQSTVVGTATVTPAKTAKQVCVSCVTHGCMIVSARWRP